MIPVDIGFFSNVTTYHVGVANHVSMVTIVPSARDAGATISVDGTALSSGSSLAVFLSHGRNEITVTVTAQDGRTTKTYAVTVDRGSNAPFGWKVTDDFQLDLPLGFYPRGLWGSGSVLWAGCATNNANIGAKLCAYNTAFSQQWDGYHTLATHGNNSPMGVWSDGTTMWVADSNDRRIYAYKTASYFRDTGKEFGNLSARGIWSDGATLWTAQSGELRGLQTDHKGPGQRQGLQYSEGRWQYQPVRHLVRRHHHVGGGQVRQQAIRLRHGHQAACPGQGLRHTGSRRQQVSLGNLVGRHHHVGG